MAKQKKASDGYLIFLQLQLIDKKLNFCMNMSFISEIIVKEAILSKAPNNAK